VFSRLAPPHGSAARYGAADQEGERNGSASRSQGSAKPSPWALFRRPARGLGRVRLGGAFSVFCSGCPHFRRSAAPYGAVDEEEKNGPSAARSQGSAKPSPWALLRRPTRGLGRVRPIMSSPQHDGSPAFARRSQRTVTSRGRCYSMSFVLVELVPRRAGLGGSHRTGTGPAPLRGGGIKPTAMLGEPWDRRVADPRSSRPFPSPVRGGGSSVEDVA